MELVVSTGAPALPWPPVCMCQLLQLSAGFVDFRDPCCVAYLSKKHSEFYYPTYAKGESFIILEEIPSTSGEIKKKFSEDTS